MLQAVVALAIKHHTVPFIYIMLFTFEGFFSDVPFFPTIKKKKKVVLTAVGCSVIKKKNKQQNNKTVMEWDLHS